MLGMTKSIIWRVRVRRFLHYISGTYSAILSAIMIPAVAIWHTTGGQFAFWISWVVASELVSSCCGISWNIAK